MFAYKLVIIPGGIKSRMFDKAFQLSECTKVPGRVTAEQMVLLIDWKVAEETVWIHNQ